MIMFMTYQVSEVYGHQGELCGGDGYIYVYSLIRKQSVDMSSDSEVRDLVKI